MSAKQSIATFLTNAMSRVYSTVNIYKKPKSINYRIKREIFFNFFCIGKSLKNIWEKLEDFPPLNSNSGISSNVKSAFFSILIYFFPISYGFICMEKIQSTGGPRITQIFGTRTIVLLEESC